MRISHYKVQHCDVWFRSIGITYTGLGGGFTMGTLRRAS